jgi:dolichol-phosphate mannosyltransferase
MKYSLVIPAYNEERNIGQLTSRIIATLDKLENISWELIYVVEGTDSTRAIAESFAETRPEIRVIYREVPGGLGDAYRRGFAASAHDSDLVITLDADLNHQPEEIPRLVRAVFERNADIVIGSRKVPGSLTEGAPLWKTTLSNAVNWVIRKVIGMPVADQTSSYRVYRYAALQRVSFKNSGFAFAPELLLEAHALGLKMVEEPIHFKYRVEGESKMKLFATSRSYLAMLASRLKK